VILSNGQVLAKGNIKTLLKEFGGAYTILIKLGKKIVAIPKLSFSRVLKASENELVVETAEAGHAMRELIYILENAGIAIENLEVREPSLRYVFSNLLSKVKQ
jgi:ABC-type multidrug transport system ATPase subunit